MTGSIPHNFIIFCLFSLISVFLTGFISFLYVINTKYNFKNSITERSDYVVVATGGSNRLLKGLDLMRANSGKRLLLTGIGKGVTKDNITKAILANPWQKQILNCCVDFDESAIDTKGNALKAKTWIENFNTNSIYLVSANYHMPRLFLEMANYNPNVKIITVSVRADSSPIQNLWKPKHLRLILNEYIL